MGFRYAEPLTEQAVQQMVSDKVENAVAFTQYPQYSCSTTGSSLNELVRQIKSHNATSMKWSVIDRWGENPGLLRAISERIEDVIQPDDIILFSAHSLPLNVVNRGDTYPQEVAATVAGVMRELGHKYAYRLVWQSSVGPQAWLGPSTEKMVEQLAKRGCKRAIVVPVAFTSDHIETLYELDVEYSELAAKHGMQLIRSESLNISNTFIKAMADEIKRHFRNRNGRQPQLHMRCPGCITEACSHTRTFLDKTVC